MSLNILGSKNKVSLDLPGDTEAGEKGEKKKEQLDREIQAGTARKQDTATEFQVTQQSPIEQLPTDGGRQTAEQGTVKATEYSHSYGTAVAKGDTKSPASNQDDVSSLPTVHTSNRDGGEAQRQEQEGPYSGSTEGESNPQAQRREAQSFLDSVAPKEGRVSSRDKEVKGDLEEQNVQSAGKMRDGAEHVDVDGKRHSVQHLLSSLGNLKKVQAAAREMANKGPVLARMNGNGYEAGARDAGIVQASMAERHEGEARQQAAGEAAMTRSAGQSALENGIGGKSDLESADKRAEMAASLKASIAGSSENNLHEAYVRRYSIEQRLVAPQSALTQAASDLAKLANLFPNTGANVVKLTDSEMAVRSNHSHSGHSGDERGGSQQGRDQEQDHRENRGGAPQHNASI